MRWETTDTTPPLLTNNVPVGLGLGSNSGSIQVQGSGHNFTAADPIFSPLRRSGQRTGLAVRPEKTLALVGSGLSLEAGNLSATGGRIELGSVSSGNIKLISTNAGLALDYGEVQEFQDIYLSSKASVDASGLRGGSVQLQGRNITISDGSVVLIQNQGLAPAGDITVKASSELGVSGTSPSGLVRSSILNEAFGNQGGNITITARNFRVDGGASVGTRAYQTAQGGQLTIQVSDSIRVRGFSEIVPEAASTIAAVNYGSGKGGDVNINTDQVIAENGGTIGTTTLGGTGNSGDLNIKAVEITVTGVSPFSLASQLVSSSGGSGDGGEILIEASKVNILEGGRIDTSTGASGDAGDIFINTSELNLVSNSNLEIEIDEESGQIRRTVNLPISSIVAVATEPPETIKRIFNLGNKVTGSSGNINISANSLTIGRGQISVRDQSSGISGNIQISADSLINKGGIIGASGFSESEGGNIQIDANNSLELDRGIITTASRSLSKGGNINITARSLQARNGSQISATARDQGKGGNILIDTGTLVLLEDSRIIANAFEEQGGNIQIYTQGIFRSPDSFITASSKLGIDGTVQINTPDIDFTRATAQPVAEPESPEVASVCQGRSGTATSQLINAGTGGIPASPTDPLNSSAGWYDNSLPALTPDSYKEATQSTDTETNKPEQLIEAQGWKWNADGTLSMTLEPEEIVPYSSLNTPSCHQVNRPLSVSERK